MKLTTEKLLDNLRAIVAARSDRAASLQQIADLLKSAGNYRWVGLYDVDHAAGLVKNIVWSGPEAPLIPFFL